MKKSERKILSILAAVTLVLAVAVILTGSSDEKEAAPEYLFYHSASSIRQLDFANGKDYIHLLRSESGWTMADDEAFSVDPTAVEMLLQALAKTQVKAKLDISDPAELEQYSLLSPDCIIEYRLNSSEAHSVRIGAMSELTEELYIALDGDESTVYVTTPEIGQAFSCRKLDLLAYPAIPTPKDGQCAVTIQNLYGTTELFKDGEDWFVSVDGGAEKIDEKTAYNYYFLTWDMHWRGRVEHNAPDPAKYDLARPRIGYTLRYTEDGAEKTFALELGSSLPDGSCYARLKDSPDIFLLDALMANWLEGTKPEALIQNNRQENEK